MIILILVEIITIIDVYHENVAGKRFASVDLSGKVYIVTGSNTGLGTTHTKSKQCLVFIFSEFQKF